MTNPNEKFIVWSDIITNRVPNLSLLSVPDHVPNTKLRVDFTPGYRSPLPMLTLKGQSAVVNPFLDV